VRFSFWFSTNKPEDQYYLQKKNKISKAGYGVITGAPWHYGSNKGAHLAVELQWD
jgi:hypothetical protein